MTVPAIGDGTSMAALSDSSTTRGASASKISPSFIHTSIISTSELSPRLGTGTFKIRVLFPLNGSLEGELDSSTFSISCSRLSSVSALAEAS